MTSALDRLPKRTRRAAKKHLAGDEHVVAIIEGRSKQAMLVTDRQILIVKAGWMAGAAIGAKAASFAFADISVINVHTGRGIAALEVVEAGSKRPKRANLSIVFQRPNWLPCHPEMGDSPVIGELRAFVRSDGRSQSARAALAELISDR